MADAEEITKFYINKYTELEDNMELKDTVKLMNSNDYKERFKSEYYLDSILFSLLIFKY